MYARREHEPRRRADPVTQVYTRSELRDLLGGCRDVSQILERMPDYRPTLSLASHSGDSAYLSHIKSDDSEDGFFQLVLLGIMGAQFYCYDHAAYNDSRIVCTHAALDACVPRWGARADVDKVYREAKAFDLVPHVQMGDEEVMVSVALFTKWGGLSRNTYRVRRAFPHEFLDVQKQRLVRYDCGVMF
jgi:hypothetical protein